MTNAHNPSTLEAKANSSWVWGSLAALITWWDPVCQTATEPCVATSADRRPDLHYLFCVGSVLSSCWQAAPCKLLCERKRGKSLQPVISVAGWIQAAPWAWSQDILHVNRCWVFIMYHLASVISLCVIVSFRSISTSVWLSLRFITESFSICSLWYQRISVM